MDVGVVDGDDGGWRDKARGVPEGEARGWGEGDGLGGRGRRGEERGGGREEGGGTRVGVEVVEPWIDVSPACPAGRERLRLDVLSFPLSSSPSLSLSSSLRLSGTPDSPRAR